jgi:hypothetical protein
VNSCPSPALILIVSLLVSIGIMHGQPQISQDRDLRELDLTKWDCAGRESGSAKTGDGLERNRLKNRSMPPAIPANPKAFDIPGFIKYLGDFDSLTKGKHRKDLLPAERQKLDPLEKEIVQVTGYLGLAYAGPPESTNCGNVDFHDWHLEVMEKPPEHAPKIGDPTSVICEITPRTQNDIYHSKVSIQALAGFFRRFDLEYESTGHKAVKVRITGFLLWDDEHNGSADVGTAITRIGANKYHNPWRQTAWEIHPVLKIEPLESATDVAPGPNQSPASSSTTPAPAEMPTATETETPTPTPVPTPATPTPPQFTTLLKAVPIKIPYGQTVLPPGTRLKVLAHDERTVTVEYVGHGYTIPATSTDLH